MLLSIYYLSVVLWCFTAGSKFGVTTSGDLYASNANISGTINATKGTMKTYIGLVHLHVSR